MVLEKLQKNLFDPYLTPYMTIKSKWIRDLNIRPKTMKLLEKKTGKST